MKSKPPCVAVLPWLKANLGSQCLAPMTGNDAKALGAAVMIAEAYAYNRCQTLASAFGLVVMEMQPKCQELAYHSAAMVMDWSDRALIWQHAGLLPITPRKCAFEPGGSAR